MGGRARAVSAADPRRVLRYATYRRATLAGLTTNIVFGLLRVAVLLAVPAERGTVAGYDRATAVTYAWLGQGLLTVVLSAGGGGVAVAGVAALIRRSGVRHYRGAGS